MTVNPVKVRHETSGIDSGHTNAVTVVAKLQPAAAALRDECCRMAVQLSCTSATSPGCPQVSYATNSGHRDDELCNEAVPSAVSSLQGQEHEGTLPTWASRTPSKAGGKLSNKSLAGGAVFAAKGCIACATKLGAVMAATKVNATARSACCSRRMALCRCPFACALRLPVNIFSSSYLSSIVSYSFVDVQSWNAWCSRDFDTRAMHVWGDHLPRVRPKEGGRRNCACQSWVQAPCAARCSR